MKSSFSCGNGVLNSKYTNFINYKLLFMKKALFSFSVACAAICSSPVYSIAAEGQRTDVVSTAPTSTNPEEQTSLKYGVSIGTVEAQRYSESGLNLNYFGNRAEYVAKTSDGTYMGFRPYYESILDDETGEYIGSIECMSLVAISSTEEAVTIPEAITVDGKAYPVNRIDVGDDLCHGFTSNIRILTIPSSVNRISVDYHYDDFGKYLGAIYMLGEAPEVTNFFQVPPIFVCNKDCFESYLNNKYFAAIIPYGWDLEWITVNVEKNGEFAETYLTQNDYNWNAAQYVKVTGNINDVDLSAIKNLTSLLKLDLSETAITSLPEQFMYNRRSLIDVKLPSTLKNIGSAAFEGCSSLQTLDLDGITDIAASVFKACYSLSYINLSGVNTIGDEAFYGCTKLNNIDLSTVEYIGNSSFEECSSLESIELTSAISIGGGDSWGYSFQNCTSLKNVTFGENLRFIGGRCFANTAIESIILPESLTDLSTKEVFQDCGKLTTVILPNALTSIGSSTFKNCTSLSQVVMKTGLSSIGSEAFNGCTAIEEITIPSTVKTIGSSAFDNTSIKTFKCYAVVPPAAGASFIGSEMDMSRTFLYVPPFSKDFYRNTQYWSNFYLMSSIQDPIDYIYVERPLSINLEEEDNAVVANNPEIVLTSDVNFTSNGQVRGNNVGQLTATGEGTLSAGQMTINATLSGRRYRYNQYCPTLINYADKMRADNVTVNITLWKYRMYSGGPWHFISLPYDVKVSDIVPSNNTYWVIRRYDSAARAAGETDATWVNLTEDDVMEAGKGYIISAVGGESDTYDSYPCFSFASGNSLTKNNIFRSTDVIVPLTEYTAEFAHNRSWNLIGNPYPCYFDMHYLNEEFTAPITVWNGSSYVAYSPVDDDLVLSPYEAFFVQCPLDAKEMTFKEGGRMHHEKGNSLYKAPAMGRSAVSVEERNVFNFEVSNDRFSDRARIVMNPEATMDYEIGRDASKFFADDSDGAQIYVAADVNYSISERPLDNGAATLGLRASKEDVFTLSLSGRYSSDWHVIITDNVTDANVDLTEGDYQFTATKGDFNKRFSVKFQNDSTTDIASLISYFGKDSLVTVTTVGGTTVYEGRISDMNVPTAGLYIISNGKESRKTILK